MNKKFNSETSGHGIGVNTWITIFLVVIAAHLIVILSVVGFKLLKGDKEILKTNEGQPSKEIKHPEEDYKLNLPPEENDSLEQALNSLVKSQTPAGTDAKDDEISSPPVGDKGLVSPQDPPSESTAASELFAVGQAATETHPKPAKAVGSLASTGNYHIVAEGDTLRKIASKTGVSIDEIRKKNHLDKDVVKIGQKLIIPEKTDDKTLASAVNKQSSRNQPVNVVVDAPKPSAPPAGNYKVYRVEKGDTLNKIAVLFRTSPENLAKINDISDPRKLKSGMEIKVPKE